MVRLILVQCVLVQCVLILNILQQFSPICCISIILIGFCGVCSCFIRSHSLRFVAHRSAFCYPDPKQINLFWKDTSYDPGRGCSERRNGKKSLGCQSGGGASAGWQKGSGG